ncbi:DUF1992 domain-containing protein [Amnibacterium sp.]|uniref:DnaJ family domain-containing protein n=1 Tax=Amnibacterium sp. TaxID=1872496 RepID=UPI00261D53DF|nr:DUF1992 domain-containing protein [Amnibacterium sp.]MCU1472983.1 molecular chaperone DnaJ [Amnibacterium sp.]
MTTNRPSDARLAAARYEVERVAPPDPKADDEANAGQPTMDQRARIVEIAIQQAQRRGDFDGLPGAGKPLTGLDGVRDPDWWIRRKIERENLTGIGPPALTLRAEDRGLDERLDGVASETAVRELLEDFNRRVREARRQLQGGPPVVTPTRDVDAEVCAWRERRVERWRVVDEQRRREAEELASMSWRQRRRARRRV